MTVATSNATLPDHMISRPVSSGVRVTRSYVFCICFVDRLLVNMLSVLLRLMDSDYPCFDVYVL